MFDKVNNKVCSLLVKKQIKAGAAAELSLVTAFAIIAIVTIVIYKLYGSKSADITLPGGFKFKFTS